jgi:hypothetical protein
MNRVIVRQDVLAILGELIDSDEEAYVAIRRVISLLTVMSPRDKRFPGFLTEFGPMIAVAAGRYRVEVHEVGDDPPTEVLGAERGTWYVYALISPDEQELERSALG